MKIVPNYFLIYVSDIARARAFYESIFAVEATPLGARYVQYEIAPGVLFSLWAGKPDVVSDNPSHTTELGIAIAADNGEMDRLHGEWLAKGATSFEPPHQDAFGYTFVVADPDGNLIRVSPAD